MSETTGGLPLMAQTQNSRYLTFNEAMWALDVLQRGVLDRDLTVPPGSPAEGDAYIVDTPATGAWVGHENDIAFYFGGIWNFLAPELAQGDGIYVVDEGLRIRWNAESSPVGYEVLTVGSDASTVIYTPSVLADWDGSADPGNADDALDQLAERVKDLEDVGTGIGGSTGATDNRVLRSDGTGGSTAQSSGVTIDDSSNVSGVAALSATTIELGHASDTTLSRTAAGKIAVEGVAVILGSTGSTDNAIPRADGTGGSTLQSSNITVSDNDEISGQKGLITDHSGTTYTFQASDTGGIHTFSNAAGCTVTLPNSLAKGWNVTWSQKGAAQVTFSPASGATMRNRQTHTKSAGQYAVGLLYVDSNSGGSAADYYFGGDTSS